LNVGINVRSGIFEMNEHLLEQDLISTAKDEWTKRMQKKAREYRARMSGEGAWLLRKDGVPEDYHYGAMNPLLFEDAGVRDRLDLKLLDEVMRSDWRSGSGLELGEHNVYASGSFVEALTDRLLYMQEKWKTLDPVDRKAWIEGTFTHSEEAKRAPYDVILLAAPDYYVG
jgi:hypothetical protein